MIHCRSWETRVDVLVKLWICFQISWKGISNLYQRKWRKFKDAKTDDCKPIVAVVTIPDVAFYPSCMLCLDAITIFMVFIQWYYVSLVLFCSRRCTIYMIYLPSANNAILMNKLNICNIIELLMTVQIQCLGYVSLLKVLVCFSFLMCHSLWPDLLFHLCHVILCFRSYFKITYRASI